MGEPRAITYKEVKRATGGVGSTALWEKIGKITGAGTAPTGIDDDGSYDLTEASESVRNRVDELLKDAEADRSETDESKAAAKPAGKKEGK
jgi:hypothetical protein